MTTIALSDAIRRLELEIESLDLADYGYDDQWYATVKLAIAALEEKAKVAPARRTDPTTSHKAAPTEFRAGSAREKLLLAAEFAHPSPLSARELVIVAGLNHQRSPWKRVSELVAAGFLSPHDVDVDSDTGYEVTTYTITEKGRAAAKERQEVRNG